MLRKDLPELIRYAKNLGMLVSLSTNGIISKRETYEEIMESGLDTFTFSIDGSNSQSHEAFRKNCSFDRVINSLSLALELRRSKGYSTRINTTTTVNRINAEELSDIYEMCQSLGVDHCNFQPIWPIGEDEGFFKKFGFTSDDKDADLLRSARDTLLTMDHSNLKQYSRMIPDFYLNYEDCIRKTECYAGRAFIYVDARGDVYPCVLLRESFGSLLNGNSQTLLKASGARKLIERAARQDCGGCSLNCHMERNVMMEAIKKPKVLVELLMNRFSKRRSKKD
jgi:radical SAM protein with 4Fe4S-binding SPASM domain